jgi:hypothetical protein
MKYSFLILKDKDEYPKILYSVKDPKDKYSMLLKLTQDFNIVKIISNRDFKPLEITSKGLYLVGDGGEFVVYEFANTGFLRDYWEYVKGERINIVDFDVVDVVSDADTKTNVLNELLLKKK